MKCNRRVKRNGVDVLVKPGTVVGSVKLNGELDGHSVSKAVTNNEIAVRVLADAVVNADPVKPVAAVPDPAESVNAVPQPPVVAAVQKPAPEPARKRKSAKAKWRDAKRPHGR